MQPDPEFRRDVDKVRTELLQTVQRHCPTVEAAMTATVKCLLTIGVANIGVAETTRMLTFALDHSACWRSRIPGEPP